jgi:hypothetical protein
LYKWKKKKKKKKKKKERRRSKKGLEGARRMFTARLKK